MEHLQLDPSLGQQRNSSVGIASSMVGVNNNELLIYLPILGVIDVTYSAYL